MVVTGVSGSGKSSLAFDTLYAEGRRRYVESLSAYSRQFLERIEKPDLEFVSGILPAIAIEAKNVINNARSTVGTQTELSDYLRLLFARIGVTHCLSCHKVIERDTASSMFEKIQTFQGETLLIAFPVLIGEKARSWRQEILDEFEKQGYLTFLLPGKLEEKFSMDDFRKRITKTDSFLVVVDEVSLTDQNRSRIFDSLESALSCGKGLVSVRSKKSELKFSNRFHCADCDMDYRVPDPNTFSFNSPLGACPECQGFGRIITIDPNLVVPNSNLSVFEGAVEPFTKPSTTWEMKQLKELCRRKKIPLDVPFCKLKEPDRRIIMENAFEFFKYLEKKTYKMHVRIFLSKYRGFSLCPVCHGTRLKPEALAVKISGQTVSDLSALTIESLKSFFDRLQLTAHDLGIAESILLETKNRLSFLNEIGLGYLTLDRLSRTLSGGEAQRIHLAASLGSALVDTLYVLDEPSIGLHERDNSLLIRLLGKLKNLGNTVVVVEHDRTMIESADQIIDLGPQGGERGGNIIYSGPFERLKSAPHSYTAKYFRKEFLLERSRPSKTNRADQFIKLAGASAHNLKRISVQIPLNQFVVITGVSGSGKSTLMYDVLYGNYRRFRGRPVQDIGKVDGIDGFQHIKDMLLIDQSPIGRTPRSNPVTYVKAFDFIRRIFSQTRNAKLKGLTASHFSFNVPGGRCEQCEGAGAVKVEMHFLADIFVTCEQCSGSRYQSHVLEIEVRGKNIRDVLNLTIDEALDFFRDEAKLKNALSVLSQVGLGYLRLGQSATTLSGGEAQRLKLAAELSVRQKDDQLLYLFDEPTTGLHYYDITFLLNAFDTLLARGHSVCVIEHNMEVIKCADYVIDLGPEGGEAGGEVVYQGTLKGLMKTPASHTGRALKSYLRPI